MKSKGKPMRRRAKPAKSKVRSLKNQGSKVGDLEKRLAEALEQLQTRNRELAESQEQQTATSEILRVIASSPTDLDPVLEAVARNAAQLCRAEDVAIIRAEEDGHTILYSLGPDVTLRGRKLSPLRTATDRAIREVRTVHVPDLLADPDVVVRPEFQRFGWRTGLAVPLVREGVALGTITARRSEVRPFSDQEIKLLETFADQAVIAIENVRLFNETKEALEQQTATSEILRTISSSPTDLQPVLDAIAASAARLCDSIDAQVFRIDGEVLRIAASYGALPKVTPADPRPINRSSVNGRAVVDRRTIHIHDLAAESDSEWPVAKAYQKRFGHRTIVATPLLREGVPLGAITIRRMEVRPFSDKQIRLLETFADQAVIAVENVRLFKELEARNRDLTATSEILQVISRSPTDVQPVFDTIAERAMQLCDAATGVVFMFDGTLIHLSALANVQPEGIDALRQAFPVAPSQGSAAGRVILTGDVVHIPDVLGDPEYQLTGGARVAKYRCVLGVPMLQRGRVIGVITVSRPEPGTFSEEQLQLLKTFADQAVIAIENVRLFTALQARNRDLTEALERQTATSDILQIISSSPTDVQPVFDAIIRSAVTLCDASFGGLHLFDGEQITLDSHSGLPEEELEVLRTVFPFPIRSNSLVGRALLERSPVQVEDVRAVPGYHSPAIQSLARYRTGLAVPMLREGTPIGGLALWRSEVRPFTDRQIELIMTFASQAVIAIENVRLFKELEARNRDLTATSEILRVIASSPTDLQPVLDTIAERAVRLCDAAFGAVGMLDGAMINLNAVANVNPEGVDALRQAFPLAPSRGTTAGRVILTGDVVQIPDVLGDSEYRLTGAAQAAKYRCSLGVPMLHQGRAIGVIVVFRPGPGTFSEAQIELLKTFADQAVIAIENVHLFKELEARTGELTRSVEKLTALGEVSRAVSSTLDVETVLDTIVSRATQLAGADGCAISEYDDTTEVFHVRATHGIDAALVGTLRAMPLRKGEGVMGRAAETREPTQIADIAVPGAYQSHVRDMLIGAGYRALLSVPLLREDEIIGSLSLLRKVSGEFSFEVIEVLKTFATQSALAIQNARLFREIADKSAQLEAASRHKSEFLANMSHELRTPLNAIIGFSEVLSERMFGELNEKQDEYLKDIYASGQHLLSLINDILDLSKIEAGRMELEVTDFDLPSAIDNALMLVRERASRRGITLGHSLDERLGQIRGDERKVKQVLLNLLSNALKFTPEGGRIDVSARVHDGVAEVSVADTGVGIAPEDQEAVFEEFRQVGTADKKVEGTGLGLALSRKFVELHGGRIWVESEVGKGSRFAFSLPLRHGA
jgi:GAF domain-containing protein